MKHFPGNIINIFNILPFFIKYVSRENIKYALLSGHAYYLV